ncbi:hypothetical protein [Cupriavidus oxalaticus]|uniref:Uncharacterized protein n=1 Tax=Cupriavidus oxalaticus TaxID=96344 RepID=A0A4P7LNY1_9BURK|nr:hypothetical protein [Cupriavidus oxalaticus]QBY54457.1 hypothetical protein E0W60_26040 [Cupriavidus oxalaticus]
MTTPSTGWLRQVSGGARKGRRRAGLRQGQALPWRLCRPQGEAGWAGGDTGALDVEAQEAKRREAAEDRQLEAQRREATRHDAARHDPVVATLAGWLGVTPAHIEFLAALVLAAALEGVACYGWYLVLVARAAVTEPVADSPADPDTDLSRLHRAIADGQIRPTVVEIRRHLGCSQAKALELRRQLVA